MKRREFIQISTYSAISISVPFLNGCTEKTINAAIAQPHFLYQIFDAKTMLETGQFYLKQVPGEKNKNKLADMLIKNSSITETSNASSVHSFFDKKIHDDFASGKTVVVNGWILSITEARQCALFSLMKSQ
jgi:hypothetical protein